MTQLVEANWGDVDSRLHQLSSIAHPEKNAEGFKGRE